MSRDFIYSSDNKRYHTLNYFYRNRFGKKLFKAVVDGGFTCPNADGSKGTGGCIFCAGGSGYFTRGGIGVTEQLLLEKQRISGKYGDVPMVAYFQANTNTYAPAEKLREMWEAALAVPGVAGISIGTRADCLSPEIIALLKEFSGRTFLTVELGMQTVHERTLKLINRCCSHEEFLEGYNMLKENGIRTCLHIINGLPGETPEMMRETARSAASMKPDSMKIQMLHVIRGTPLAEMYAAGGFRLLSREEYIAVTVSQLELLPPETVIERITGDGDKHTLIAPEWSADKIATIGGIDKFMAEQDTWQGRLYFE